MVEVSGLLELFSPERRAISKLEADLESHIDKKWALNALADLKDPVLEKIPEKERSDLEQRALTMCLEKFTQIDWQDKPEVNSINLSGSFTLLIRSANFFAQVDKSPQLDKTRETRKQLFQDSVSLVESILASIKAEDYRSILFAGHEDLQETSKSFYGQSFKIPAIQDLLTNSLKRILDGLAVLNAQILVKKGPVLLTPFGPVRTEKQQFSFHREQFPELFPLVPKLDLHDWHKKTELFDDDAIPKLKDHQDLLFPLVNHFEIARISALYLNAPEAALKELNEGLGQQKKIIGDFAYSKGKADKLALMTSMLEVALDSMILAVRICSIKNITQNINFLEISMRIEEISVILAQSQAKLRSQPLQNCFAKSAAAYSMIEDVTDKMAIAYPTNKDFRRILDSAKDNVFDMGLTLALAMGLNRQDVYDRINDYSRKFGLALPFPPQPTSVRPPTPPKPPSPIISEKTPQEFQIGKIIESTDNKKWFIIDVRRGGQATVLIVKNPDFKRTEVLRIYREGGGQRSYESAQKLIELRDGLPQDLRPYFPEIYGSLEDISNRRYLRMEFVNGITTEELAEKQKDKQLKPEQVIEILRRLIPVLKHLHTIQGPYVLRDIKPSNFMINQDKQGKVASLYLTDWDVITKPFRYYDREAAFGTEAYAAPEQIFSEEKGYFEVWPPSDIYALGITINQWLTGIEPQGPNYTGEFKHRFPELVTRVQKKELKQEWLELIEGCTRINTRVNDPSQPYRWSIIDVKNWLEKFS